MKITFFHYHLALSGVTSVIRQMIHSLSVHSSDIESIRIIVGKVDPSIVQSFKEDYPIPISIEEHPVLDYLSTRSTDRAKERIKKALLRIFSAAQDEDSVWWIHNYHIGKNPLFTAVLLDVLPIFSHQRVVLHVHDFPENGRYPLFSALCEEVDEALYPVGPNIRYVVLNSRDRGILINAGLPSDMVWYIPNPVTEHSRTSSGNKTTDLRKILARAYAGSPYSYDLTQPHVLYPVRCIRRKNVLEAALFLRVIDKNINLIVTLPGVSEQEAAYSRLLERAYCENLITGLWSVGTEYKRIGINYEELFSLSDFVISSSIQEGFGYQYFNSLLGRKRLLARYVPVIRDMEELLMSYPHVLYDIFHVPMNSPGLGSINTKIQEYYQSSLQNMRYHYLLHKVTRNRLEEDIDNLGRAGEIDFCLLPPDIQYSYLRDIQDEGFRRTIYELNKDVCAAFQDLATMECPDMSANIAEKFGAEQFVRTFTSLITSFHRNINLDDIAFAQIERGVYNSFCNFSILSPLYGSGNAGDGRGIKSRRK